jgi:hypothetical protein
MPEEPESAGVRLPLVFVDAEERTYQQANVFIVSINPDGCFLTAGQIQFPPLLGMTPEEQRQQAEQLSYVGVKVVAKLVMTPQRLTELRDAINMQLGRLEA